MAKPRVDALHRRVVGNIRRIAEGGRFPVSHLPDRAGVGRSHFWSVMAGSKSPTLRWLGKIAAALDTDVEDLVSREHA